MIRPTNPKLRNLAWLGAVLVLLPMSLLLLGRSAASLGWIDPAQWCVADGGCWQLQLVLGVGGVSLVLGSIVLVGVWIYRIVYLFNRD